MTRLQVSSYISRDDQRIPRFPGSAGKSYPACVWWNVKSKHTYTHIHLAGEFRWFEFKGNQKQSWVCYCRIPLSLSLCLVSGCSVRSSYLVLIIPNSDTNSSSCCLASSEEERHRHTLLEAHMLDKNQSVAFWYHQQTQHINTHTHTPEQLKAFFFIEETILCSCMAPSCHGDI